MKTFSTMLDGKHVLYTRESYTNTGNDNVNVPIGLQHLLETRVQFSLREVSDD